MVIAPLAADTHVVDTVKKIWTTQSLNPTILD
jgi:hypothetical protein